MMIPVIRLVMTTDNETFTINVVDNYEPPNQPCYSAGVAHDDALSATASEDGAAVSDGRLCE